MAPPSWAYQADNFDPPADEELLCSICRAVFRDPVQCPCNHVFCRACISKWLQTNKNCPVCRKRATRASIQDVVPLIKNMILKLILRCKNSEKGCDEKFSLEACQTHMRACLYEMVKCKNSSCSQRLLRKEIENHEKNECLFRCFKCKTCGLNISTLTPIKHSCIKDLQKIIKEKNQVIKLQEERIQQLMAENNSLKDAERDSETSSGSISTTDIMISVSDFTDQPTFSPPTLLSDSSITVSESEDNNDDSFREWFNTFDDSSTATHNTEQEGSYEERNISVNSLALNVSRNTNTSDQSNNREVNLQDSIENPRSASPWNNNEPLVPEVNDSPPTRRPNKRRYASRALSISDGDNSDDDSPTLRSPKRCWRMNSTGEQSATNSAATQSDFAINNRTSNSFMEAGPSFRSNLPVNSGASCSVSRSLPIRYSLRARSNRKNANAASTASATDRLSCANGEPIFERTIKLLERYNLESDPEWTPKLSSHGGNDSTSDSDDGARLRSFRSSSEDSSWSNDDLDYTSDSDVDFLARFRPFMNSRLGLLPPYQQSRYTFQLFAPTYESSDDDDEEWRPRNPKNS